MKVRSESESLSHVRLLATPWTAAHQAPSSMGFSRQEYWSGVPSPQWLPKEPDSENLRPCPPLVAGTELGQGRDWDGICAMNVPPLSLKNTFDR